jgi:hypothetical protein
MVNCTGGAVAAVSPEVVSIALGDLRVTSPFREDGLNREHVERLVDLAGHWPPILVGRADRRVIDGVHRVAAARQLGLEQIGASLFDGGPDAALIEFVRRNVHHGLPLTFRERKGAARRILVVQPGWSDRRVAELCGISPKTVARLRTIPEGRPSGEVPQLDTRSRLGRDNRTRPVDSSSLRSRIAEEIKAHPGASLRAIASTVGASPETVRSVRMHLAGSTAGPPDADRTVDPTIGVSGPAVQPVPPPWRDDAAILSLADGDDFVAWFERTSISEDDCTRVEAVPLSRIYEIADEARRRSGVWAELAQALEARSGKKAVRSLPTARKAG